MHKVALLILPALLTGCFSTFPGLYSPLNMTYTSDPVGAMVYQGPTLLGYAPVAVEYPWELAAKSPTQCMRLQPITVRWASGAEAKVSTLSACASKGHFQQFSFVRPTEIPGRELDVQFALKQQELALMQQQAAAQERAAMFNLLLRENAPAVDRTRSLNCMSSESGGVVYTSCQ
jgi:hypothetical protein